MNNSGFIEKNYHLSFWFEYGKLDDETYWIRPPSKNLFQVNQLTLRIILELNSGSSICTVSKKYGVSDEEVVSILNKFSSEGAIVEPRQGKITNSSYSKEDISLLPFIMLVLLLGIIQAEYLNTYAETLLLKSRLDGFVVGLFAVGAVFFHELGHYIAIRKFSHIKPKYGFMFLFIFPALYVDTQYAWMLPKNKRLLINASGCVADLFVNTAAVILFSWNRGLEYFITPFLIMQYTRWSIVLNPLFSGDGYWILSDTFGVVNLTKKGFYNLKRLKLNIFSLFGLLSLFMMLFSIIGIGWYVFNIFRGFLFRVL